MHFDHSRVSEVGLYQAMAAADVAQTLIHLECLGFRVDPEPLISRLLPTLKRDYLITTSELSIFWYARRHHRSSPMSIRIDWLHFQHAKEALEDGHGLSD